MPYNNSGNSTIAEFDSLTDFVGVTLGDYNDDCDTLYLMAYDSSNNQIGNAFFANPASSSAGHTLEISVSNIAWAEFYGVGQSNNSVYWDNFTFNETAPVPEPFTILLMGIDLPGLVGYSRKRSKKS